VALASDEILNGANRYARGRRADLDIAEMEPELMRAGRQLLTAPMSVIRSRRYSMPSSTRASGDAAW